MGMCLASSSIMKSWPTYSIRRLYFAIALLVTLLLSLSAEAKNRRLGCFYDSRGIFTVWYRGTTFKKAVRPNYPAAICASGQKVAALYDGEGLLIFDIKHKKFIHRKVEGRARVFKAVVRYGIAAFYNGQQFLVYDSTHSGFFKHAVSNNNFSKAIVAADRFVAGLYDGSQLVAYDSNTKGFSIHSADKGVSSATILAKDGTLIAYDGDDLYSFCSGKSDWNQKSRVVTA